MIHKIKERMATADRVDVASGGGTNVFLSIPPAQVRRWPSAARRPRRPQWVPREPLSVAGQPTASSAHQPQSVRVLIAIGDAVADDCSIDSLHYDCPHGGEKRPSSCQQRRTFTGTLSASWSWDLLYVNGWRLVVSGWWRLAVGGWRRLAVGGWRLAVGGSWGLSLRAFLRTKKNLASPD